MERINKTSLKLVKQETKKGNILLSVKLDSFTFLVSTRNTKIQESFIADKSINEIPLYLDLIEKSNKDGKIYLSVDLYAENDNYLFSIYCDDRNLAFLFNQYIRNLASQYLTDDERLKYGM